MNGRSGHFARRFGKTTYLHGFGKGVSQEQQVFDILTGKRRRRIRRLVHRGAKPHNHSRPSGLGLKAFSRASRRGSHLPITLTYAQDGHSQMAAMIFRSFQCGLLGQLRTFAYRRRILNQLQRQQGPGSDVVRRQIQGST